MAGLLAGKIAPIDHGDGPHELMDIRTKGWHSRALDARCGLGEKIAALVPSTHIIGPVSRRFGLNENAVAIVWSGGQSGAALIGLGLLERG